MNSPVNNLNISRRTLLAQGTIGATALSALLNTSTSYSSEPANGPHSSELQSTELQSQGILANLPLPQRAKRVIWLTMAGGPSHLELFDYKPKLAKMHGQPMPESFTRGQQLAQLQGQELRCLGPLFGFKPYGSQGTQIGELLPHLGNQIDNLCLIRSMTTDAINHDPAHMFMNTGSQISGRPSMGAWIHYGLGSMAEGPQHEVTLAAFWMAQTLITQAQWREVAGWEKVERDLNPDPSFFKGDQLPVERVSWFDAMEFCHRLSQRTGRRYTLPSEAQWEYACRAGSKTPFAFGDTLTSGLANYDANYVYGSGPKGQYRLQTTDVGSFAGNAWGLQDMHGNVWEWCLDEYHHNYNEAPNDGSAWVEDESLEKCCAAGRGSTSPGTAARLTASTTTRTPASTTSVSASVASPDVFRLLRGGSWDFYPAYCRSACRGSLHPDNRNDIIGFRVCCLPQG